MKTKMYLCLILAMCLFGVTVAQEKKYFGEAGAGLLYAQGGFYKTLSSHSAIGASGYLGLVLPAAFAQVSPQYRYYFNGITTHKKHGFVAVSGINFLAMKVLAGASEENKWELGIYANAGIGYEWNFKNFIIRPTLSLAIPITKIDKKIVMAKNYWVTQCIQQFFKHWQ